MATTTLREDFLGRDLLSRATTSTVDSMGRALRRGVRANNTAVTLGQEIQFTGGTKYVVKTAGTTAGSAPSIPDVGADVTDGTAVLTRTK
jgi:ABC-type antimicrobial peptide transport system permease subunit